MRLVVLLVLVGAVALPATARAGAPPVTASAYVIEDARTGEVLASSNAHAHLPIASITKLMTVLLTLEHHKLTDVVTVDPRAASVNESSIDLSPGEQLTVRDLLKGALIQSANDAADALALSIAPDYPAFARLMNAKAVQLGLRDSNFVRPDGLDAPGEYSSAADVTRLARLVMRTRFVRETVREETDTIAGGRTLHTWDDLLQQFPATIGVKTGHTDDAGWCQVAAGGGEKEEGGWVPVGPPALPRRHDLRDPAREPDALAAERRPAVAPDLGARPVPRRALRAGRP
jgi:serine-type D-Ala-D-Ala carboxypeptidase (penicillin-binding protein 5/6)